MNSPCCYCKDRVLHCHSSCIKYKTYRDKLDFKTAKRKQFREELSEFLGYQELAIKRVSGYKFNPSREI